jgi:hypothetical protein
MNVFGSFLVLVMIILYILFKRGKFRTGAFKVVLAVFGTLMLGYGIYQLSVAELLSRSYPGKYYTAGGWIAISLGIIALLPIAWNLRKNRNGTKS